MPSRHSLAQQLTRHLRLFSSSVKKVEPKPELVSGDGGRRVVTHCVIDFTSPTKLSPFSGALSFLQHCCQVEALLMSFIFYWFSSFYPSRTSQSAGAPSTNFPSLVSFYRSVLLLRPLRPLFLCSTKLNKPIQPHGEVGSFKGETFTFIHFGPGTERRSKWVIPRLNGSL